MKFSIITPSYNSSKYIRDCIESVKAQKNVEVEHIIQDAGSTDGTIEILQEYKHLKVYIESDEGMSDGINKGAKKSSGDWWMWLNTDDYLLPNALSEISKHIQNNPDIDVIYGDWNFVDCNKKLIKPSRTFFYWQFMMVHYGCYIASTAILFKKSSTIDSDIYLNKLFKQVMDQEYFARLGSLHKKFLHISIPLAEFRIHDNNTSMHLIGKRDIESIFKRQLQFAESATIRRKYGFSISKDNPIYNGLSDGFLWIFLRISKIIIKITKGCYKWK